MTAITITSHPSRKRSAAALKTPLPSPKKAKSVVKTSNLATQLLRRERGISSFSAPFRNSLVLETKMASQMATQTVFKGHEGYISSFDIEGSLVVTLNRTGTLRGWDRETGALKWALSFPPRGYINWTYVLKISQGKVICTGTSMNTPLRDSYHIFILDGSTGNIHRKITNSFIHLNVVGVAREQIFALLKDGRIGRWNFDGQSTGILPTTRFTSDEDPFLAISEEYLVLAEGNKVQIYHFKSEKETIWLLTPEVSPPRPNVPPSIPRISALHFAGSRLTCGLENDLTNEIFPECCTFNLQNNKEWEYLYLGKETIHSTLAEFKQNETPSLKYGHIQTIQSEGDRLYLNDSEGRVFAVDLSQKTNTPLTESSYDLALEGNSLVTLSDSSIILWDAQTLKEKVRINIHTSIPKISFLAGTLFAAVGRFLLSLNYSRFSPNDKKISTIDTSVL